MILQFQSGHLSMKKVSSRFTYTTQEEYSQIFSTLPLVFLINSMRCYFGRVNTIFTWQNLLSQMNWFFACFLVEWQLKSCFPLLRLFEQTDIPYPTFISDLMYKISYDNWKEKFFLDLCRYFLSCILGSTKFYFVFHQVVH